jgi:hypothetical protein
MMAEAWPCILTSFGRQQPRAGSIRALPRGETALVGLDYGSLIEPVPR